MKLNIGALSFFDTINEDPNLIKTLFNQYQVKFETSKLLFC